MPLPSNDSVIRGHATDGVEIRTHSIGGKTPGLLSWSATCIVRRDGKLGPGGRAGGGDHIEAVGTPIKAYQRKTAFDDMTCVLVVEAEGNDPLPTEATRGRFLESLKRTGKPAW